MKRTTRLKAKTVRRVAPKTGCGVKNLMEEQDRLCGQLRIVRALLSSKHDTPWVSRDHETALADRIRGNHERASHMQARTIEGCLFQIQLAYSDMHSLPEIAEDLRPARQRRATRLLYAATEYLGRLAPHAHYSDCRQEFMPTWENIGGRVEQAMKYTWEDAHGKAEPGKD
jgi:hypothetical protein